MALYNAILEQRPDLLAVLCEPFYYLRHTVMAVMTGRVGSQCFHFGEGHRPICCAC